MKLSNYPKIVQLIHKETRRAFQKCGYPSQFLEDLINKSLYILLSLRVLINTDLDNETEQLDKEKYISVEYDDKILENLMKYFEAENYEQLESFLKNCHIPSFN